MAIFAVVGAALTAVINQSITGWASGTSRAHADSAAALVVHKLSQDVRVGSSATVTSGQLYVVVPPLVTDAYGETHYDTTSTGTTHRYYLSNDILYRQEGAATAAVYARDISSISFSVSGDIVTVSVTSQNQVGMSQSQEDGTARIVLRNFGS